MKPIPRFLPIALSFLALPAAAATGWLYDATAKTLTETGVGTNATPWVLNCSASGTSLTVSGVSQTGSAGTLDLRLPAADAGGTPAAIVAIGSSAFKENAVVAAARLPDTLAEIGSYAFMNCPHLAEVRLSDTLRKIGDTAFGGCTRLRTVEPFLPDTLESVAINAFNGDLRLASPLRLGFGAAPGALTLGNYVFRNCAAIPSAEIGPGVTALGAGMFYNCTSLASADLHDGIATIGQDCFNGCTALARVTPSPTPAALASLGQSAYRDCARLAGEVALGTNGTACALASGGSQFYGCSKIESIVLGPGVSGTVPQSFACNCTSLGELVLGENVTGIGSSAFDGCSALPSVVLPDGLVTLGGSAFSGCTSLASVTPLLPAGVTSVGNNAFRSCKSLGGDLSVAPGGASGTIGEYAFYETRISSLTTGDGITEIKQLAFQDCKRLERAVLSGSLRTIGGSAFSGCTALASVTPLLPATVTSVGNSAFRNCTSLEGDLTVAPGGETATIGEHAFYATRISSATLGDGIATLSRYAFFECPALARVALPANLATIGNDAFNGCAALATVTPLLPATVTSVGTGAFSGCNALEGDLVLDGGGSAVSLGEYAFQYCYGLASADLGAGVASIPRFVFRNDTALSRVVFGAARPTIHADAFSGCAGYQMLWIVPGESDSWDAFVASASSATPWGSLTDDQRAAYAAAHPDEPPARALTVASPANQWIVSYAPSGADARDLVVACAPPDCAPAGLSPALGRYDDIAAQLPMTLTAPAVALADTTKYRCAGYRIEEATDAGFANAQDFALGDPSAPSAVYDPADAGLRRFSWLWEPTGYKVSLTLPADPSIGTATVSGADADGYVPAGATATVTAVGGSGAPFARWHGDVPAGHETDATLQIAMDGPKSLTPEFASLWVLAADGKTISDGFWTLNVSGPRGALVVGKPATSYALGVLDLAKSISGGGAFAQIGSDAFAGNATLRELRLPGTLVSIGSKAFYECRNLATVTPFLPASVTNLQGQAFDGNAGAMALAGTLTLGTNGTPVVIAGTHQFRKCRLGAAVLGPGVSAIPNNMFESNTALLDVRAHDALASIGAQAFYGCGALTNFSPLLPASLASIGNQAFDNMGNAASLATPLTLGTNGTPVAISGTHHFRKCRIPTVVLGPGVSTVPNSMFEGNAALLDVRAHDGIASIGSQAFSGCSALTNFFPLLPASLASLGSKAFDNGGAAMSLATPLFLGTNGTPVAISGDCTFRMCRIPSAVLGPGATALPSNFLRSNAALRRVAMHDGVVSIGAEAFRDCTALEDVSPLLPASLESLGKHAFYNDSALAGALTLGTSGIDVALGADGYQFYNTRITNAVLGRRVGSVPPYAFANNPDLADVRLVSKSSIGNCAFENDKGLRNLYLGGPLPELHANAFKGWTAGQCLLHVQTNDETWEAWIRANVTPWDDLSEDLRDAFFDDWPERRYALGRTVSTANPASQWVVYWSRFPPPTTLIVK